jgi:hypothetical protein
MTAAVLVMNNAKHATVAQLFQSNKIAFLSKWSSLSGTALALYPYEMDTRDELRALLRNSKPY